MNTEAKRAGLRDERMFVVAISGMKYSKRGRVETFLLIPIQVRLEGHPSDLFYWIEEHNQK